MAVEAKIQFQQGFATPPAGEAYIGVAAAVVTVLNFNNANVISWEWEILDRPPGSAVPMGVLASGVAPSASFTPDLPGGYSVALTVLDLAGNKSRDVRVFQVPESSGYIIPPLGGDAKSMNFGGQKRGWAPYLEDLLRYLLANIGGGPPPSNQETFDFRYPISAETVTLPFASAVTGAVITVKDANGSCGTNNITVQGSFGQQIDGATSFVMNVNWMSVSFTWNGSEWSIV